ncbi:MAG: hypothetical protein QF752_07340 [Planctomycetota bacterium]|nr:hypothetical protein [Planctomycetota bacterium]
MIVFIETVLRDILKWGDQLLKHLDRIHPLAGLLLSTLVGAILIVAVYRLASQQNTLLRRRERIIGSFVGTILYSHSLRQIGRSMLQLLGSIGGYLKTSARPVFILILLLFPLAAVLELRYGSRPFAPGETCLLTAHLKKGSAVQRPTLLGDRGIQPIAGPIAIDAGQALIWKLRISGVGEHRLRWTEAGSKHVIEIPVHTEGSAGTRYSSYAGGGVVDRFSLRYPSRTLTLLGMECHWAYPGSVGLLLATWCLAVSLGVRF